MKLCPVSAGLGILAMLNLPLTDARASATGRQSFRTEILPILTKAGCNAGACHGAATGQAGFKLSLLGYDPEEDYERITREAGGRRVDFDVPGESLFVRKPTRQLDHEGGRRIPRDSDSYQVLLRWITNGAPYGPRDLRVEEISVEPVDTLLGATNKTLQLQVTAKLSDGRRENVTSMALFTSNDDAVAEVTKTGEVTTRGRGLTSIMVRYSGQVAAARVAVPFASRRASAADFPPQNFIDEKVRADLGRMGLEPSPLSDDAEFLRRVHLDLAGRLPSVSDAKTLLRHPLSAVKRLEIIDSLLQSQEFVDLWTMRLADLLLLGGKRETESPTRVYYDWLHQQIAQNIPFDQIVRSLITATGEVASVGPANFYALASDPRDMGEHVSRMFLGTQIACARCHAHPVDRWTQEDYYRFAAYFARVSQDSGVIRVSARGGLEHPKTGKVLEPEPLGGFARCGSDRGSRVELAEWITAPENKLFSRSIVNRVWKHLLGRGLVEPADDLRPTNPPTNPDLLEALAADFTNARFDLRHLVRAIVASRTYQLSSRALPGNRMDDRFYSHAYLKQLPAQVFTDAVCEATGVSESYENYIAGTRAVRLISSRTPSYSLDVLGRCSREKPCEGTASSGGGLAAALHLINGSVINDKLKASALDRLFDAALSDSELIHELYLRTLTRPPRPAEMAEWKRLLAQAPNKGEATEDLLWGLLNSREFAFNH